jgi:integration host factor subunit alpha
MARKSRTSITRVDLTEAAYQQAPVTKEHAAELVHQVLEEICSKLEMGETVKLTSFGVFTVRNKAKRVGRNPKTGIEVPIEPRRAVIFTASPVLKERVNRAPSQSVGTEAKDSEPQVRALHEQRVGTGMEPLEQCLLRLLGWLCWHSASPGLKRHLQQHPGRHLHPCHQRDDYRSVRRRCPVRDHRNDQKRAHTVALGDEGTNHFRWKV